MAVIFSNSLFVKTTFKEICTACLTTAQHYRLRLRDWTWTFKQHSLLSRRCEGRINKKERGLHSTWVIKETFPTMPIPQGGATPGCSLPSPRQYGQRTQVWQVILLAPVEIAPKNLSSGGSRSRTSYLTFLHFDFPTFFSCLFSTLYLVLHII